DAGDALEALKIKGGATTAVRATISDIGKLVESKTNAKLLDASECTAPHAAQNWPFNSADLVAALGRNVAAAKANNRLNPDSRIAVLDTGLLAPPVPPFTWDRLSVEAGNADQFGIDAAHRVGSPVTVPDIDEADHGTMVATLALGGTDFLSAD